MVCACYGWEFGAVWLRERCQERNFFSPKYPTHKKCKNQSCGSSVCAVTWHLIVAEGKYKNRNIFNTDSVQLWRRHCLDSSWASLMFFVFHASSMWPLKPSSSHWWVQLLPTTGISKGSQLIRAMATIQQASRELLGNGSWLPMAARCMSTYALAAASHP